MNYKLLLILVICFWSYKAEAQKKKKMHIYYKDKSVETYYISDLDSITFAECNSFVKCGDLLTDSRDGVQYKTVLIGTQCWMAENLNVGKFVISDPNSSITGHSDVSDNGIIEKYCYDNDTINCIKYGGLYDWNEAMEYVSTDKSRGICPEGWHIPGESEYQILFETLGDTLTIGGKLKATGFIYWANPNTGATNESGFAAVAGGYRDMTGYFYNANYNNYFWTSTIDPADINKAWYHRLFYDSIRVGGCTYPNNYGFSIRCLKD